MKRILSVLLNLIENQKNSSLSRKDFFKVLFLLLVFGCSQKPLLKEKNSSKTRPTEEIIPLPSPQLKGIISLEEALAKRRSKRAFLKKDLELKEISQLLWAAQGITEPISGFRTAPSAGALYPLEVYLVKKEGVYHYNLQEQTLEMILKGDKRRLLAVAALNQDAPREAPVTFVITAVFQRTAVKYGDRAERYVKIEVGHVGQNILLQAVALGLGGVPMGAFYDDMVQETLSLPQDHKPLYLIPIGHPAE